MANVLQFNYIYNDGTIIKTKCGDLYICRSLHIKFVPGSESF